MRELLDIVSAYDGGMEKNRRMALATVVGVTGSTYRRPGARMLFGEEGRLAGLINAACLESDLSERAAKVIASGNPELISYDTTSPDDIVFGLGLGCNGTVEILMEPSQRTGLGEKISVLSRCVKGNRPMVMGTVIAANGANGTELGDFVAFQDRAKIAGNVKAVRLRTTIEEVCASMDGLPYVCKSYPHGNAQVRVFYEVITPPLPLVIFGAGPDAIPLVDSAKLLGWNVTVVDHRPAYGTPSALPKADAVLLAEPEAYFQQTTMSPKHIVVIMTHNFAKDRKLLKLSLNSDVPYVGLLGPKSKLETLLRTLEGEGFVPTATQLARLHAPIGLDIGAETPEEIAFSIISEIKAVLERRTGGFLKDRKGAIH